MTFATHLHPLCLNISVVTYSPFFFPPVRRCDGRPVQLRQPSEQTTLPDDLQRDVGHHQWKQSCASRFNDTFESYFTCLCFCSNVLYLTNYLFFTQRLNSAIIYDRDFSYNFFGFKVNIILLYIYLYIYISSNYIKVWISSSFFSSRLLSGRICWRLTAKVKTCSFSLQQCVHWRRCLVNN